VLALVFGLLFAPAPQVACEPDDDVGADEAVVDVLVVDGDGDVLEGALVFGGGGVTPQLESGTDSTGHAALTLAAGEETTVLVYHDVGDARAAVPIAGATRCTLSVSLGQATREKVEAHDGRVLLSSTPAEREKGQTMQGAGIGMLALGGSLGIGSAIAAAVGGCGTDGATGANCARDTGTMLAVGFGVSGAAVVGGGIAMIVLGGRLLRAKPTAALTRGGAVVGVRGRF
jgi:hypothetical protein